MKQAELLPLMDAINANLSNYLVLQSEFSGKNKPFGFLRKIDFGRIYAKLSKNFDALKAICDQLDQVDDEDAHEVGEYAKALNNAQFLLSVIAASLYAKSRGEPYTSSRYRSDLAEYRIAEAKYLSTGSRMNAIYSRMKDEPTKTDDQREMLYIGDIYTCIACSSSKGMLKMDNAEREQTEYYKLVDKIILDNKITLQPLTMARDGLTCRDCPTTPQTRRLL